MTKGLWNVWDGVVEKFVEKIVRKWKEMENIS